MPNTIGFNTPLKNSVKGKGLYLPGRQPTTIGQGAYNKKLNKESKEFLNKLIKGKGMQKQR